MSKEYQLRMDPVKLSIIQHRLDMITEEMATTMLRTARSTVAAQAKDFSVSAMDAKGWLIAVKESLPCILWGQGVATRNIIEYFKGDISQGDLFIYNDPFLPPLSSHLNDWTVALPVFYKDELVFWTGNRLHQLDTGGNVPGGYDLMATEIHQEGIRIPPVKLYEAGKLNWPFFEMLLANVRVPSQQRGDIMSQIGSCRTGERRLHELIDKYGLELMKLACEDLLNSTETATRAVIKKLPDGVYRDESSVDGDPYGGPYTFRLTVIIEGEEMTLDWSGSDPMVKGWINSSYNNTFSQTYSALAIMLGHGLPFNEGMLKPLKLVAPEGTIVNATYPHAVGRDTVVAGAAIMQAVWKALAPIMPERAVAPYSMGGAYIQTAGTDPRTDESYACLHFPACGGGGASWGCDGWHSVASCSALGALYSGDVEIYEHKYPFFIVKLGLNQGSAGAGKWRGGLGVDYQWINEGSEGILVPIGDQHIVYQPGVLGGKSSPLNRSWVIRAEDKSKVDITQKKIFKLYPGDLVVVQTTGGAGVGDPLDRDPEAVREDVMNERVLPHQAKEDYGVIFKVDKWPYEIDQEETKRCRSMLKGEKKEVIS